MNKYEVLGVVGEGAYGVVLKCKNKESGEIGNKAKPVRNSGLIHTNLKLPRIIYRTWHSYKRRYAL